MDAGRSRLVRLAPAEITALVGGLSSLAVMWARPAKVSARELQEGRTKAVRAVQVNLPRDASQFLWGLAWSTVTDLIGDVESARGANEAQLLAQRAGAHLGRDLGPFVVQIVGESSFALSEAVRADLETLLEVAATEPPTADDDDDDDDDEIDEPYELATIDEREVLASTEQGPVDQDATVSASAPLARDLRALADMVEGGGVPADEMDGLAARARELSTQIRASEASRAAQQAEEVARRDELQDLVETVEGFLAAGKEKYVAALLGTHDFTTIEELRDALAELDGVASLQEVAQEPEPASSHDDDVDPATEPEPGPEPEPEPAKEPAPDVEPEPDPEPESKVEPEQGPKPEPQLEPDSQPNSGSLPEATVEPASASALPESSDPWTDGELAGLIASQRELLAVVAAESLGVAAYRVRMLRLFAGAYGSRTDTLLVQEPELILEDTSGMEPNADENRLLLAAHARLALELGFSPVGSLERYRQGSALEGHPAGDFASEVVKLVLRGFKRPLDAVELTALPDDWRSFAEGVDRRIAALESTRVTYQRASRIVHYLVHPAQEIGRVLRRAAELARQRAASQPADEASWTELEALLAVLRNPQQRERLLHDADKRVSSIQQVRKPIIANAWERLLSALDEVAATLEEGLALRARAEGSTAGDDPQGMADLVALAHQSIELEPRTVGDAALRRLIDWVLEDVVAPELSSPLAQLLTDELLPLFEIPRDAEGAPVRLVPDPDEVRSLVARRDPLAIVRGYLAIGNIKTAQRVVERLGGAKAIGIDPEEIEQATQTHRLRHRDMITGIERVLDRLRSLNDEDLVRELTQELEQHTEVTPGRYDVHADALGSIRQRGEERLSEVNAELRKRAATLPNKHESQRILDLLDALDEQLAVDYITLAEAGEPLPVLAPPAGDDFGDFFPTVVRVAESANRQRQIDNLNVVRKHLGASSIPSNRMLAQGLRSWNDMVADKSANGQTQSRLANVLRMLGLIPAGEKWIREVTRERHAGYATYAVKANPIDRSYVPSFGSQAHGTYDVTVVWDERSPKTLLSHVEQNRRMGANLILYTRTLSVEQRLELRRLTARSGFEFSPLVVDMPVIAWLTSREEPGWRVTQRVTLPFTTVNPYTPFAGGEVPDEVFVGRETERRQIIEPTGSMFVYGGRQLGKSALLRRVERGIMAQHPDDPGSFEHGQLAIYLDLKSEGIGESSAPSALWAALAVQLERVGVLATEPSPTADSVTTGILDWLEADKSRRLLLLLDEADNFLTLDAKGQTELGSFPVLQKLKGVMERTRRRFKPVFAGLHQVQRFHGLPNTPVVHGGQDILIGPLSTIDARELVRDPLFALGYRFETSDTMWRLLRLTNYQASLVQIICEALVRHMRIEELPASGGRVVITSQHVDDVYAKRDVRDLIAQRFRWTINLDNRYKVIALVTALRSLDSKPGERFSASTLHDDCENFWPAGFARSTLSSREFFRYLDEMQGLGVLHRQQGQDDFGLRSPSILGLIGSRDTIEEELIEATDQLEVDYQYNPAVNRRILSLDATGAETRSPLTDADLADLLRHSPGESRVKVVVGTPALGIARVPTALHKAASDRGMRLFEVDAATLADQLAGDDDAHLVLDLTGEDSASKKSAIAALADSNAWATVVLSAPDVALASWPAVQLRRWSLDGLKSLHESLFRRTDLKEKTGGWPELVEKATSYVARGAQAEVALDSVANELREPGAAREFLAGTGVPREVAQTWIDWFGSEGDDGEVRLQPASAADLEAAFESDPGPILDLLESLDAVDEEPEGWRLDGSIVAAVRHAAG